MRKFLSDMFTRKNLVFSAFVTALWFYIPWWIPVTDYAPGGGLDMFWWLK